MKIGNLLTVIAISSPFYAGAQFIPSWSSVPSGTTVDLNSVIVVRTGILAAFAAGDSGVIIKGNNFNAWPRQPWSRLFTPTLSDLFAIDFLNENIGYAAGKSGIVIKTMDGGTSWTTRTIGSADVFAIQFLGTDTGWAVGSGGFVAKTTNGGTNWTRPNSGTTNDLHSVFFRNANSGFAVGNRGTILKSVDGGNSWSSQPSGTLQTLRSISFSNYLWWALDDSCGWIAGDSGTILKSRNSGSTWLPEVSGTIARLASVQIADTITVNIVGENIILSRYLSRWVTSYFQSPAIFNSISGSNLETFAVGQGGKIVQAMYEGGIPPLRIPTKKTNAKPVDAKGRTIRRTLKVPVGIFSDLRTRESRK